MLTMASRVATRAVEMMKQVLTLMSEQKSFDRVMKKVNFVSGDVGRCVCELKIDEDHINRGGFLHGGLTATLVDSVSTLAVMTTSKGVPGVSVDMNVTYMKAAPQGTEIVINANTLKVGKTLAFLTVDITNKSDGSLVAQGRHTIYLGSGAAS